MTDFAAGTALRLLTIAVALSVPASIAVFVFLPGRLANDARLLAVLAFLLAAGAALLIMMWPHPYGGAVVRMSSFIQEQNWKGIAFGWTPAIATVLPMAGTLLTVRGGGKPALAVTTASYVIAVVVMIFVMYGFMATLIGLLFVPAIGAEIRALIQLQHDATAQTASRT
jgi:hypothetical protein